MRLTVFGFKGVLFYAALVLAFFASPYSNLFFLLLGFLSLMWVQCALATRRNMRGVIAEIGDIEPAPAGSGTPVHAHVAANGRARFGVTVAFELESGARGEGQVDVMSGAASVTLRLPALERGVYRVRRASVSSTYPLGLLSVRRNVTAPAEVVVYPAPIELATARSGSEVLSEALGESVSGAGDLQPSSLRDHREGDDARAVHWRATARRGSLVVKELEGGAGDGLEVLIDRRCGPDALEESLSIVAAIVLLARTNKDVLVVYSQGLHATFGAGHRPWSEALRFLAAADALPASAPAPPPVSPSVPRLPPARTRAS